jgi:hypothetical protein
MSGLLRLADIVSMIAYVRKVPKAEVAAPPNLAHVFTMLFTNGLEPVPLKPIADQPQAKAN